MKELFDEKISNELKKYELRGYDWSIMQLIRLGLINDIDSNKIDEIINSKISECEIYFAIMDEIEKKMNDNRR